MTTLITLPPPVLHIIYSHLAAKDRAALASTCTRLNEEFGKSTKAAYVQVEDHRPYLRHLKMQDEAKNTLETSSKNHSTGNSLYWAGICGCAAGIAISGSCGGCCCCSVSAVAAKVLCYTGLSLTAAGFGCCATGAIFGCREKNRTEQVALVKQYNEEEHLLQDLSQKLRIDRAARQPLEPPPPEPSYQACNDYYGPA